MPITKKFDFFVLSSDFEEVIKKHDPTSYEEARKNFSNATRRK
jgi:hypothetical protein